MSIVLLFQIFINNEFVNSESGKVFPTINPTTEEKIADIQEGDKVLKVKMSRFRFWLTVDCALICLNFDAYMY